MIPSTQPVEPVTPEVPVAETAVEKPEEVENFFGFSSKNFKPASQNAVIDTNIEVINQDGDDFDDNFFYTTELVQKPVAKSHGKKLMSSIRSALNF